MAITPPDDPTVVLSEERTGLSLERTQLAWVRTGITMIGAGFGLDRGLAALYDVGLLPNDLLFRGSRLGTIALTVTGTAAFLLATIRYLRDSSALAHQAGTAAFSRVPTLLVSAAVLALGLLLSGLLLVL